MATNKIQLRTVEEFMADYTPVYQPIYPLLMGRATKYSEDVGKVDFRRVSTIGDLRTRFLSPKDTSIKQIAVGSGKVSFKKYFLANQYIESELQEASNIEEITAQVLDEHQKQMDELMLYGEGTNPGSVVNDGLFYSGNANYTLNSDAEIDSSDPLTSLHSEIVDQAMTANRLAGRKLVLFYGTETTSRLNGIYTTTPTPFRRVLADVLGPNYSFAEIPTDVLPSGGTTHGFVIVNLDMIKFHYVLLPTLRNQGVNEEKYYSWHNFLMASCLVEPMAKNAIIRTPITMSA